MTSAIPMTPRDLDCPHITAGRRWRMPWAIVVWGARLGVSALFAWAAIPKMLDPAAFALAVDRYELLPTALVAPVAITLPWIELVAVVALFTSTRWRIAGGLVLAALLVVFAGAIGSAWARGLDVSCGCFGTIGGDSGGGSIAEQGPLLLLRNAGLLVLLTIACCSAFPKRQAES